VKERRLKASEQIDQQVKSVSQDVSNATGDTSLISSCMHPFEALKTQLAQQESLAHIAQTEIEALNLKDAAVTKIEAFIKKKPAEEGKKNEPPKVKPRRVVQPVQFVKTPYLETEEDVNKFINALRQALTDALANDERIEIR
jgi:histidinol dehydrogenase